MRRATKDKVLGGEGELTQKQLLVIESLVAGETGAAAARSVGVAPERISRWKRNPFFVARLNERQKETLERIQHKLNRACEAALDATIEGFLDPELSQGAKLQAATNLLTRIAPGIFKPCQPGPTRPADVVLKETENERDSILDRVLHEDAIQERLNEAQEELETEGNE
jgi:hypothetical protein